MSDYEVTLVNDNMQEFYVRFHGPKDSMNKKIFFFIEILIFFNLYNKINLKST